VPEPGRELERDGILIEVMEATETQVTRARLRRWAIGHPAELAPPDDASTGSAPESAQVEQALVADTSNRPDG
jgi:hypothetical protein